MIIFQIRTGHQLLSQSSAKLKLAANQNYFESQISEKVLCPKDRQAMVQVVQSLCYLHAWTISRSDWTIP